MNKNNINSKNDNNSYGNFCIDLRQFLHINLDKEKFKDELRNH